jgi:hypothetical protein
MIIEGGDVFGCKGLGSGFNPKINQYFISYKAETEMGEILL